MRYIILPKGYAPSNIDPPALELLHRQGPNTENADVVGIDQDKEFFRASYTGRLARKMGASIPEIAVKTPEGMEVLGEHLPFFKIGTPPIIQLLLSRCKPGLSRKEIISIVFDEFQILPKTSKFRSWLDKAVKAAIKGGYLVKLEDKIYSGFKKVELGRDGYDVERGIYPVERLIYDMTANYGKASVAEIADTVHAKWQWVTNRWAAKFWVDEMIKQGFLKKVGKDYEVGKLLVAS